MKKIMIMTATALTLMACNDPSAPHAPGSHGGKAHHQDTGRQHKTMQDIMDGMMHAMHGAKMTGDVDVDFATMMMEHHRGAVEMSQLLLEGGSDTALARFAKGIIGAQQQEIRFLDRYRAKGSGDATANKAFGEAMERSMSEMRQPVLPAGDDMDSRYATLMIPHHQSAVDMARAYLAIGKDESLSTLCNNIIRSQTAEIAFLQRWLKAHKEKE